MAEIIKAPVSESSPAVSGKMKRLQKACEKLHELEILTGRMSMLSRIGRVYMHHQHAVWMSYGYKSLNAYLEANQMDDRTGRRYIQIAEAFRKFVGREDDPDFVFDVDFIKNDLGDRIKLDDCTIHGLAAASRDMQLFTNYITGTDTSTADAVKMLVSPAKVEEPKQLPAKEATDLLSRMKAKGYIFNHEKKRFENPDGSPLTIAQIGEFVQEDDVMDFIRQTKDTVESFKKSTYTRLNGFSVFFEAFLATTHSPESKRKVSEEIDSLVKEAQTLAGEILEQLPEEQS